MTNANRKFGDKTLARPTIVIGSTGFVGRVVRGLLRHSGICHVFLDRSSGFTHNPNWAQFVQNVDLSEAHCLVLSSAGVSGPIDREGFRFNSEGLVYLLQAVHSLGAKRFTVAGSVFEYGGSGDGIDFLKNSSPTKPLEAYGLSKLKGSEAIRVWAESSGVSVRYMRLFQLFGVTEPPQRLLPSAVAAAKAGEDFSVLQGLSVRDFTEVHEVANKLLHWVGSVSHFEVFNVCSGLPMRVGDLVASIWSFLDAKGNLTVNQSELPLYPRLVGDPREASGGIGVAPIDLRSLPWWDGTTQQSS